MCGALLLARGPGAARAQAPSDPASARLSQVLPEAIADHVVQRINSARGEGLPAEALTARALELSAKGVAPERIARTIDQQAGYLDQGNRVLRAAGRAEPSADEIDAAATALGRGVDPGAVSELAGSAPSGRSLAVPLLVLASLVDRGLPVDNAMQQVLARVASRASDRQLEQLADGRGLTTVQAPSALSGQDVAANRRPDIGRPDMLPTTAATKGNRPTAAPARPPGGPRP
jgi:type II secretory pathway component PulK